MMFRGSGCMRAGCLEGPTACGLTDCGSGCFPQNRKKPLWWDKCPTIEENKRFVRRTGRSKLMKRTTPARISKNRRKTKENQENLKGRMDFDQEVECILPRYFAIFVFRGTSVPRKSDCPADRDKCPTLRVFHKKLGRRARMTLKQCLDQAEAAAASSLS